MKLTFNRTICAPGGIDLRRHPQGCGCATPTPSRVRLYKLSPPARAKAFKACYALLCLCSDTLEGVRCRGDFKACYALLCLCSDTLEGVRCRADVKLMTA